MSGGSIRSYEMDEDAVPSDGCVEFPISMLPVWMTDWLTSLLLERLNNVQSSFEMLADAVATFDAVWRVPADLKQDLLYPAVTPQPWALHEREKTSLELAIERWQRDNPIPQNRYGLRPVFERDETVSRDTIPCSGPGARWSDLMADIDGLIGEA